jgi:hypothetical protein
MLRLLPFSRFSGVRLDYRSSLSAQAVTWSSVGHFFSLKARQTLVHATFSSFLIAFSGLLLRIATMALSTLAGSGHNANRLSAQV